MRPEVIKGLLGLAIGAVAGITIVKMAKSGNFDLVIDKDTIISMLPKQEKILNPNGEDLTIKPKPEMELIEINIINDKEVV